MSNEKKRNIAVYAIAIAIPVATGLFSALLTRDSMQIYSQIITPPLAPPSILFPIVWTILYILMGISSGIVWQKRNEAPAQVNTAISYYAMSLAFNFVWSIIFFNFRQYLFAFVWLLGLLYLIVRTILAYKPISPAAAYLQIPYALWVSFAGYLNLAIWLLNR